MQTYVNELAQQSTGAGMIIIVGAAILKNPTPMVMVSDAPVDRMVTFKLLGAIWSGTLM